MGAVSEAPDHPRRATPLLRPTSWRRLALFLVANLAGYAYVNAFWLYLSTGQWCRLRPASFVADFTSPTTLPDLFERVLDVLAHPWMIAVGGVLLGIVLFVPLIVAVLYRLWFAMLFVAVVLVAGHAPAMAVALAAGCVLAARTPLRRSAPYLAALLGMVPVGLYLYLFSSADSASVAILPIQRWALKAPYLLAVLLALAAFAAVLNLARLARYRSGVIWPVLTVLLAVPVTIFYWKIGPAELEYQLIAAPLAAGDALFEPVEGKAWVALHQEQGLTTEALAQRAAGVLEERKAALQKRCRRFLERFRGSPRAPAIAWVLAQCQGLQLDRPALEQGWVKSTAAHPAPVPNEESEPEPRRLELRKGAIEAAARAWETLLAEYGDSPQAALAAWRLSELDIRRAALPGVPPEDAARLLRHTDVRLQEAMARIVTILEDWDARQGADRGQRVFSLASSLPPREYYGQALEAIRRLLWLMHHNDVLTDLRAAQAMGEYLQLNGYGAGRAAYQRQVYDLAGKYEDTPMATNLKLAAALTQEDPNRRADQLVLLAEQTIDPEAAVEAAFELGHLLLQAPSLRSRPDVKDPRHYFRLVRDEPGNPWQKAADQRLQAMKTTSQPARP